jgi:hypothetical protein
MHVASAECGTQRDKFKNIHMRDIFILNKLWNWSYWLEMMRYTRCNNGNCKKSALIMMYTYS